MAAGVSPNGNTPTPAISVVVPTRAEAENVGPLVARLDRVLPDLPVEVIFVDDSDDDTPDAIRAIESSRAVYLIHRQGGSASAGSGAQSWRACGPRERRSCA